MFEPKCYTLINKRYEPKKDIRMIRRKIYKWKNKLNNMLCEETHNIIFENIIKYIDETEFPRCTNMEFNAEALEGWNLITHRNKLEKE